MVWLAVLLVAAPSEALGCATEDRMAGSAVAEGLIIACCGRRGTNSLYIIPAPALCTPLTFG